MAILEKETIVFLPAGKAGSERAADLGAGFPFWKKSCQPSAISLQLISESGADVALRPIKEA
jgi:hypothetical protein